jgi:hypothetical protein
MVHLMTSKEQRDIRRQSGDLRACEALEKPRNLESRCGRCGLPQCADDPGRTHDLQTRCAGGNCGDVPCRIERLGEHGSLSVRLSVYYRTIGPMVVQDLNLPGETRQSQTPH